MGQAWHTRVLPLSHYRSHLVFIPSTLDSRITNQLDFFPDPLFTFEDPTLSTPPPDPTSSSRPSPTLDGSDLIGQSFLDPELGVCHGHDQPAFLQPNTGNLAPGQRLSPGWHPILSYISPTGTVEHSTVTEVARWIQDHPPPPTIPPTDLPPQPPTFVLEPVVVPTRTLRPRHQAPQTPMPPTTAPPTLRRSPRFTALRCATIPVPSAGGLRPTPRSVFWSKRI